MNKWMVGVFSWLEGWMGAETMLNEWMNGRMVVLKDGKLCQCSVCVKWQGISLRTMLTEDEWMSVGLEPFHSIINHFNL